MKLTTQSIIAPLAALAAGLTVTPSLAQSAKPTVPHYAGAREDAPVPRPGTTLQKGRVALVVTDPQNDFLSPNGVAWGVVGQSVQENNTVPNIESLLRGAKASGVPVFVSPHYYYPHDHQWKFGGALEVLMHQIGMFDRKGALNLEGFTGSGAENVPVKYFAGFYATGWDISPQTKGCPGENDPHPLFGLNYKKSKDNGDVWGHFINIVQFSAAGLANDDLCNFDEVGTCIAVLVE